MNKQLVAVIFLGLVVLITVICATFLVATDHDIPDLLVALGPSALSALAALLVPSSPSGDDGQVTWPIVLLIAVVGFILGALCYANGIFVGAE
jgi:multisubunit Na+/H+ antiporter MnhF subunit